MGADSVPRKMPPAQSGGRDGGGCASVSQGAVQTCWGRAGGGEPCRQAVSGREQSPYGGWGGSHAQS